MSPERRYRLLLLAYPRGYRDERAEEMLDVLLARRHRSSWSGPAEAVSLVGHGLALRLRGPAAGTLVPPSVGLAGVSLALLLAVLGVHRLVAAGQRGLGLDGYPDAWRLDVVWVDPRWPVQVVWVLTGVGLLLGRHRLAVASAWTAAALNAWHFLVTAATTVDLPWPGHLGPHWTAYANAAEAGWLVLSVAAALLLGGPGRTARSLAGLSRRRRWSVVGAGLVGTALAAVAGPLAYGGPGTIRLAETARGPAAPLLLAGVVLVLGLLRAPYGRGALGVLGVLSLAPLTTRWSEPLSVLAAGAGLLAAGYALAWLRRGRLST